MKTTGPLLFLALLLLAAPPAAQAQFTYTTNSGVITLAAFSTIGYGGTGGQSSFPTSSPSLGAVRSMTATT
jgi:hypothetical protein